jgi:hypothetical protein
MPLRRPLPQLVALLALVTVAQKLRSSSGYLDRFASMAWRLPDTLLRAH